MSKGQITSFSTILMISLIIVLIVGTYSWGSDLVETQETRTTINYMQANLLDLESAIVEVSHEGENATRAIQIDVSAGKLYVADEDYCIGDVVNSNGIVYELSTENAFIDSSATGWINIDPYDSGTDCEVSYFDNSAGLLLARTQNVGDAYVNQYMIWFRKLTSGGGNYLINISKGTSSETSGGGAVVSVRNTGTVTTGGVTYINVEVNLGG
ncbi:MAG: hypothetical protein ABIG20_04780 [archaeon]